MFVTTATVAQQTPNQYEPPNASGAGQRLLAQFVGDWDVVKTFFPVNGKPIVTKATCRQYMIQDGKFLQSDFAFLNSDGSKSTGTGISGFDSKTNPRRSRHRNSTLAIHLGEGSCWKNRKMKWPTNLLSPVLTVLAVCAFPAVKGADDHQATKAATADAASTSKPQWLSPFFSGSSPDWGHGTARLQVEVHKCRVARPLGSWRLCSTCAVR